MTESDDLKIEKAISQSKTDRPDLIKVSKAAKEIETNICLKKQIEAAQFRTQVNDDLESVYSFEGFLPETGEKQPDEETSEHKFFMDWNRWNSFLDIQKCYARIYACIDSFKEKF